MKTHSRLTRALLLAGLPLVALLSTVNALAGMKIVQTVVINKTSRYFYGTLSDTRNSSNSSEYIGCQSWTDGFNTSVYCTVRDAAGEEASCSSSNRLLFDIVAHQISDSRLWINYNASGTCTNIQVDKQSYWAPKNP
jgi:hypothetical protein